MNKLGFKNFRKFKDFEPLEYSGITFLVGRNNAGKSTFVKALLLINDFLKSNKLEKFHFGYNHSDDVNIPTFGRAKNNKSDNDLISFKYNFGIYEIDVEISGSYDDILANVHLFSILDKSTGFKFEFLPQFSELNVSLIYDPEKDRKLLGQNLIKQLKLKLKEERNTLLTYDKEINFKEYLDKKRDIGILRKKITLLSSHAKKYWNSTEDFKIHSFYSSNLDIIQMFELYNEANIDYYDSELSISNDSSNLSEDFRKYKDASEKIVDCFKTFIQETQKIKYFYLGAYSAKQSGLLLVKDKSNALAQAVNDFYQLRIGDGEQIHIFVKKWVNEFEIGNDYKIKSHIEEAYEVLIASGDSEINIADKGMGSIQAFLLILQLAVIIHFSNSNDSKATIIIEEPELNLHPALQSKLADLFLDVHERFKIKFIIETHSEYILRKSQVLVAVKEFEVSPNENPFCVYYFPKNIEEQPYRLNYQEDGSFQRNFGPGFFDEASASTLELLKIKRQKRA